MKHPELLLLPLLMFSDYFLTILGAIQRNKRYGEHFKVEHYELNPVWQKAIRQRKWFNPRHILLTLVLSGYFVYLFEFGNLPESVTETLKGFLFCLFGMILGRHISNLFIFWEFIRKPDHVSGEVTMAHPLALRVSIYQYLVVVIPLFIIAIFSTTPFVIGAFAASIFLLLVHCVWIVLHKRRANQAPALQQASSGESEPE